MSHRSEDELGEGVAENRECSPPRGPGVRRAFVFLTASEATRAGVVAHLAGRGTPQ